MKRKYLIILSIVLLIIALFFLEASRTRKKELSCTTLKQEYPQYPFNYDHLKDAIDQCSLAYQWLGSNEERLEFTVDGIHVKIGKVKAKRVLQRRGKKERDVVKTQMVYHDTLIRIHYTRSKEVDELVDIFADFSFQYKGYFIKGSIRGIYRQNQKAKVKDVPQEVFTQTEQRILAFVDQYFI